MLYSALTVLPDHMYPAIAVNNKNDLLKILAEPSKVKCSGYHIHTFLVPNIYNIGKRLPETITKLQKMEASFILSADISESKYIKDIFDKIRVAKPLGSAEDLLPI